MPGGAEHDILLKQLPRVLSDILEVSVTDVVMDAGSADSSFDAIVRHGFHVFVAELKMSAGSAVVLNAANHLKSAVAERFREGIPLIVVPFMGSVGKRVCTKCDISWIDLSGNANITAPGLKIRVEGKPNLYKRKGRPSSVFAPKSARIVRWLLVHPERRFTEDQLSLRAFAAKAKVDPGLTSRVLNRLEEDGYISRQRSSGLVRVLDRDRLLDDWRDHYDFDRHTVVEGHMTTRSGQDLLRRLGENLEEEGIEHAATGLGAAWFYTRWATFRLVTYYVAELPDSRVLDGMGFRETERGGNVWLVVPNDEGVFHDKGKGMGFFCADPLQIYLDLDAHPERASEMAPLLRRQVDIARRLRAYHEPVEILNDYRSEGISKAHIDYVRSVISSGVRYQPPLPDWGEKDRNG